MTPAVRKLILLKGVGVPAGYLALKYNSGGGVYLRLFYNSGGGVYRQLAYKKAA